MSSENTSPGLRERLLDADIKVQAARLKCYYYGLTKPKELEPFTGAHFDMFEPQTRSLNKFTTVDLYAVSALSVNVPPKAGFKILSRTAPRPSVRAWVI